MIISFTRGGSQEDQDLKAFRAVPGQEQDQGKAPARFLTEP